MAETRQFRKRTVAIGPSQGEQEEANESLDSSSRRGLHLRLVVKSHYLSDLSLDTIVTRRCRVYLCVP